MRAASLCFLLGIVLFVQCPELPSLYWFALLPFCLLGCRYHVGLRLFTWAVAGFLWAFFCATNILSQQLATEIEGVNLELTGKVVSLPLVRPGMMRFELEPYSLFDHAGRAWPVPGKIRLSWYQNRVEIIPGQIWRLQVRLKRPYGFMNPGGLDYEGWLFQRQLRATGYVLQRLENTLLAEGDGEYLQRLRYALRSKLVGVLGQAPNAALLLPLIIGERGSMSSEHWRILTATGTNHLMAISGLHIGFIAFLAFWLMRIIWPLGGPTSLFLASPYAAMLSALVCAAVYAALAGFAIPTQRALAMLVVFLGLRLLHRQTAATHIMALALLAVLLIDPFAVLSAGFWLSFAAFSVILYGMNSRLDTQGLWWRWGRVQLLLAIGLIPLLIFWFQQIPLLGMPANIIAVPWVSIFTVPLALLGALVLTISEPAGAFVLQLALKSVDIIWSVLTFLAALEFAVIPVQHRSWPVLLLAAAGVALLLMPAGLPGRYLGLVFFLPLAFPVTQKPRAGELHFTALDVGQGLAVVLRTQHHVLLYDTGARYSGRFNAGSAVISPYLRSLGITELDKLIVSHGDNDHIGGFHGLTERIQIRSIVTSVPDAFAVAEASTCDDTQRWQWDGVIFDILHPAPESGLRGNNASCVLRVSVGGQSLLLTGDIEKRAEKILLERYGRKLAADILLAPHHGSRTSSSEAFLDAVQPHYAIFPVGYRNRFGFPKRDIIARYKKRNIRQLQTARSGAIEFQLGAAGLALTEYRQQSRRFWHTVADDW